MYLHRLLLIYRPQKDGRREFELLEIEGTERFIGIRKKLERTYYERAKLQKYLSHTLLKSTSMQIRI